MAYNNDGGSDDGDSGFFVDNPTSLINIGSMSKLNEATNRGGCPKNSLLDGLLQKCYHRSEPGKHLFWSVGSCGMTYVNRNLTRTVHHTTGCHRLPAPIRIEAKSYAASKAPSRKLSVDKSKSTKVNDAEVMLGKNSKESQVGTRVIALKKRFLSPVKLIDQITQAGGISQAYQPMPRRRHAHQHCLRLSLSTR